MRTLYSYIWGTITAIVFGVVVAFALVRGAGEIAKIIKNHPIKSVASLGATNKEIQEEEGEYVGEEEDGSFVRRFSREFFMSLDDIGSNEELQSPDGSFSGEVNPTAKAYMIERLSDSKVIASKEEDRALPIASITKLATAVTAERVMDGDQYIEITDAMLSAYGNEGRLRKGERLRVSELLYPLLMVSSNDAGEALARGFVGGKRAFVAEMNKWAQDIGAYQTYFDDPSGISPYNVSTPKDMAIIMKALLRDHREILDITMQKSKTVRTHTWINPTHFLNLTAYKGGKNGYTSEAGRTALSLFEVDLGGKTEVYIVSVLGSDSRDRDVLELLRLASSDQSVVRSK